MQKIKVSIGIPAYNEGRNIKNVLEQVLKLEQKNHQLLEVLVYTDGCSDDTADKVRSVKSKLIKLFESHDRRGKTFRLGQMFKQFKGDILLMLDGDIQIEDKGLINYIVDAFNQDKKVMLVGGNTTPKSPTTFFEKAVFSTFQVFYESRLKIKEGNNIFGATGACLAIRKPLARKMKLPKIVNEDAYIYLYCLSEGFKFRYVDKARVFYKLPKTTSDYLRQVLRSAPKSVFYDLERNFGELTNQEFYRPTRFYALAILKQFFKNPIGVSYIILVNLYSKPFAGKIAKNYNLKNFTAVSTH